MFFRHAVVQANKQDWLLRVGVGLALVSAGLLPLNLLATQRFHHDEALYATWALEIASGHNPWLVHVPIDKPPLYLYTLAGALGLLGASETAARLPSLLATIITVGLTFGLGRRLYGSTTGLLAAWLVALSPFTILFAPTALTDPLLVMLVLSACLVAVYARPGWTGFFIGLAIATKQQGVLFVPLVVGLGILGQVSSSRVASNKVTIRNAQYVLRFTLYVLFAALLTLLPIFAWDAVRDQSPGFWQLSVMNYGGLQTESANLGERWGEFIALLKYGTAAPVLNGIFVIGLPVLLMRGVYQMMQGCSDAATQRLKDSAIQYFDAPAFQRDKVLSARADWIFFLFVLAFLLVHAWLSFQVWDRYLLGLIPILALLLARILLLPWSILRRTLARRPQLLTLTSWVNGLVMVYLLAVTLAGPVQDAVNARYPLGSNSHALSGIEQITAYLQGHAGANTTLYHRWLGTHWRFYLWGYPYDLQYWQSPADLTRHAQPGHLIAFPSWRSDTEARLALAQVDLTLKELTRAYTPAGYPSIILYEIQKKGGEDAK